MRSSILKTVLALCAVFTFGNGSLQDSTGTKPGAKKTMNVEFLRADITPPIKIPSSPPEAVFEQPVEARQEKI